MRDLESVDPWYPTSDCLPKVYLRTTQLTLCTLGTQPLTVCPQCTPAQRNGARGPWVPNL